MALAAPNVEFPDMTGLVQQSQARSNSLMDAAWAQIEGMRKQQIAPQAQQAAAERQLHSFNPSQQGNYSRDMSMWNQGGSAPQNVSSSDRDILAQTLQAEAGGEGLEGMLAAGAVINNRVRSGGYGDGLRGVIMKPGQFSAWNGVTGYANGEGAIDMAKLKAGQDAYAAADLLLSGQYQDPTGGATHYYNPSVATPAWGQKAGGDWRTIGNHVFGFADAGRAPQRQQPQAQPQVQPQQPRFSNAFSTYGQLPYNLGRPA